MNLTTINTDAFISCMRKVRRQLMEPGGYERLMDEAREDTPIIEGLCQQISMLLHIAKDGKSEAVALAHRDLEVFLALREMERRETASYIPRLN